MGPSRSLFRPRVHRSLQKAVLWSTCQNVAATRPSIHIRTLSRLASGITQVRGAKTISRKRVKELTQGAIQTERLPAQDPDESPQKNSLLQGVRNNMVKFDQCVVLTRVGNFYELYYEHAQEYGRLLGLKVASRSTTQGLVAMAGFPFWQLDRFLKILVQDLNKYVAISEEFPATPSGKVKSGDMQYERKVARIVTPGTLIDENFLDPYQNNFLLAIQTGQDKDMTSAGKVDLTPNIETRIGLAWLDLSTGDFFTQPTTYAQLPSILMRIGPHEILLPENISHTTKEEISVALGHSREMITLHKASSCFASMSDWNSLLEVPMTESADQLFTMEEKLAGHQLLDYVRIRLPGCQLQLRPPRRREDDDILNIDRSSIRGLEILETAKDGLGRGSLFHAVRKTVTKGGSRLLRDRLTSPSTSLSEINERLDLVSEFHDNETLRESVTDCLRQVPDVKRLVQKFAINKGDADDMLSLARAVKETSNIYDCLQSEVEPRENDKRTRCFRSLLSRFHLNGPIELSRLVIDAIDEEGLYEQHRLEASEDDDVAEMVEDVFTKTAPEELGSLPRKARSKARTSSARAHYEENEDPWIMRRSASETLNRLHDGLEQLKLERSELQERLRGDLGTAKLELRWTPGLGHICHIASAKAFDEDLLRKVSGRIISASKSTRSLQLAEWSRLGERLAHARLRIRTEETYIFRQLRQHIIKNLVYLRRNAVIVDELDVATSFAVLARDQSWSRPKLNKSLTHKIVGGRHPTVGLGLEEQGRSFVANDLMLGEHERVWIVTGPNMAGKSTFLRQNALITILAQVGSYVPAEHAEIGLVDKIFSRIGAADDLFRDQSTFMVEMLETAAILKHSTSRSFIIMDEVGRGTTPEDGTAVSFASLHHLYNINKSRTLFATHFHALIDMTEGWTHVGRYCTDVAEDNSGSFSFIHKLRQGVNRHSHALKVAKMAGLPESALNVAKQVQAQLMAQKHLPASDNT